MSNTDTTKSWYISKHIKVTGSTGLHCKWESTLKNEQNTPVLDKVQGRMAGVLKEEYWPNPR